jgi:HD-like signal output (HDOD) protein
MWKKLKRFAQRSAPASRNTSHSQAKSGRTEIGIETRFTTLTAQRLDALFSSELLGVRSLVGETNGFESRVMKRVERLLSKSTELGKLVPRVPAVIPRLLQSLKDENTSSKQLAALISEDPALLASVIRYANSSYYLTREPINSVELALLMLGRDRLRSIIAKAALQPLYDNRKDYFSNMAGPLLWEQTERCAHSCACLAASEKLPVFEVFLAGLVHKIGYRIVTRIMTEEYDSTEAPRSYAFRDWLTTAVAILSWRVSMEWELPETVTDILQELADYKEQSDLSPFAGVVYLSSKLSELHLLAEKGCVPGGVKRLTCRLNGRFTDACRDCYEQMSKLNETQADLQTHTGK